MNDKFQNSLLITALKSLENDALKEFDQFIQSPFFNKNTELCRFWGIIKNSLNNNQNTLNKEKIHESLYGSEAFKDSRIRLLMSDLLGLFDQYLIHADVKNNAYYLKDKPVHYYREKGLLSHFSKKMKKVKKGIEKNKIRNTSYFGLNAALNFEEYQFEISQKRVSSDTLKETFLFKDLEYILTKLRYACILSSNKAAFKSEVEIEFLEEILAYIKKEELFQHPAIGIYYNCYRLLENEEEKYFDRYKYLLSEHIEVLDNVEIREVFLVGVNYCIRQINLGKSKMSNALFELFELGLKGNYLLVDGNLSRFTYRNIVTIGLINKKYDWVENFIHEYKPKLDSKFRESMFTLNLALLKYERKDYDEVQELLYKYDQKDLLLNLFAKTILLKVYFEQGSNKLLDSHLDAMEIFIRRKKVIGYHRKHYMNIIKYTRKLLKLNPYDKEAKSKLLTEVKSADTIAEKNWLLKMMED